MTPYSDMLTNDILHQISAPRPRQRRPANHLAMAVASAVTHRLSQGLTGRPVPSPSAYKPRRRRPSAPRPRTSQTAIIASAVAARLAPEQPSAANHNDQPLVASSIARSISRQIVTRTTDAPAPPTPVLAALDKTQIAEVAATRIRELRDQEVDPATGLARQIVRMISPAAAFTGSPKDAATFCQELADLIVGQLSPPEVTEETIVTEPESKKTIDLAVSRKKAAKAKAAKPKVAKPKKAKKKARTAAG